MAEMQAVVESSEEYLSKQQREGSDSHLSVDSDTPGQLKHSDSLLLLTQVPLTLAQLKILNYNAQYF